jgi:nucleotide-binding universal stress UspA family protein
MIVLATSGFPRIDRRDRVRSRARGRVDRGAADRACRLADRVPGRALCADARVPRRLGDPFESPVLCHARELAWRHGTAATLQLVAGDPPQAIVAAAVDAQADLLVIGARRSARSRGAPTRRWIQD